MKKLFGYEKLNLRNEKRKTRNVFRLSSFVFLPVVFLFSFNVQAQSWLLLIESTVAPVERTEVSPPFTVCKVDSEMIQTAGDRTFESAGSWLGLIRANANAHAGSWSATGDNETRPGFSDVTSFSLGAGDSVIFSFWAMTLSTGTASITSIADPILVEEATNLTGAYVHYIFASTTLVDASVSMALDESERDVTLIYFDDFSLIWRKCLASYSKTIAYDPSEVYYDNVLLTEQDGAGKYVGSNKWDYASGKLYVNVGEDPAGGTLETVP